MKAMVLLHGRGSTSEDIMGLSQYFGDLTFAAPQAPGRQWYPSSFLAPVEENQPELDKSLQIVKKTIEEIDAAPEDIFILGFSQGACLALEFAARNPQRYRGIAAFSGGLITLEHRGDMHGTPVFLGVQKIDPHIPLERVEKSAEVFDTMRADVTKRIYPGMGHTINEDEIEFVQELIKGAH